MKNSKLISYLLTFSKEEVQSFKKFIASPYFNNKQELIDFFSIIEKVYPKFEGKSIEKEIVYGKFSANVPFNEKHLGYLMSDLCRLIERFFQIEAYESKKYLAQYHFLDSLVKRKLIKTYQQRLKKIEVDLQNEQSPDAAFFLHKYLIYNTAVQLNITQQKRKYDERIEIADESINNFYFTNKLSYGCSILNNKNILTHNNELNFVEEITTYLESTNQKLAPCLEMYFLVIKMLNLESDDEHFFRLKAFIYDKMEFVIAEDAQFIYSAAINYCARRIREGKRQYAEEALNFYLHGVESEIFLEDGYLAPQNYKNIINLSMNFRSFEWIENFIIQYSSKLPPKNRENALNFNLASLYYFKKDYDQAIIFLNKIVFSDISYNFSTKEFLMRIYYEIGEEEPLLSLIASFSLFLKRNKTVSKSAKLPFVNFCSILNKIMRRNPKKIEGVIEEIKTSEYLTGRSWLLKQANDFKASM